MEAQVGFLHEQMAGLYGPIFEALERLRADGAGGSADDLETVVRFLEADIYCFRSGYATADAIRAVRRASFGPEIGARLRRIVLTAVDGYDRREFRAFCRLATSVSDEGLRTALVERLGSANPRTVRHARWVLDALAAAEGRPQP